MKKDERCRLLYEAGAIVLLFFGAWVIAYTWLPSALRWPLGIICIVLEIVLQAALRILDKEGEWSSIVNVRKRLNLLYDHDYSLCIRDDVDVYTVELNIPLS